LQCLPPGDPRVLCTYTGIRLLETHSFHEFRYLPRVVTMYVKVREAGGDMGLVCP